VSICRPGGSRCSPELHGTEASNARGCWRGPRSMSEPLNVVLLVAVLGRFELQLATRNLWRHGRRLAIGLMEGPLPYLESTAAR